MTWFAVRTLPGAQMPQRVYEVETTSSSKGYRIVPSLNARESAIERALSDAGFDHYMPAEKRLIRDRLRTDLYKTRRFALMVGYVFVRDPQDFFTLSQVPGVAGIVGCRGVPLPISIVDILMLRTMEAKAEVEFDKKAIATQRAIRRKAHLHGDKKLKALVDSLDLAGTTSIQIDTKLVA